MQADCRNLIAMILKSARMAVSESRDATRAVMDTMKYAQSATDPAVHEAAMMNVLEAAEKADAAAEKALNATRLPTEVGLSAMTYAEGGYRATRKLRNRSKRDNKKKGKSRRVSK